jgi:serine/threonine-protein kinase HipA
MNQNTFYGKRCLHCYEPFLSQILMFMKLVINDFMVNLKTPQLGYRLPDLHELAIESQSKVKWLLQVYKPRYRLSLYLGKKKKFGQKTYHSRSLWRLYTEATI